MGKASSTLSMSHMITEEAKIRYCRMSTVPECLEYYAGMSPDKEAVVFSSTDGGRQSVTFKKLYDHSKAVACALVSIGIKPKECVAISLRTCPEWLYVAFGSMMIGAIPIGVTFTYKDGRDLVSLIVKLQKCSCMVVDPGFENENWNILSQLLDNIFPDGRVYCRRMPSLRYLFSHSPGQAMSEVRSVQDLVAKCNPDITLPETEEGNIAILFQTSGSTGFPKAVAHTHRSLLSIMSTFTPCVDDVFGGDDIYFCDRPFGWIGGFPVGLFIGQTRVTTSGFCPLPANRGEFLVDVIVRENCSVVLALPTVLSEIAKRKASLRDKWSLKTMITGGQPIIKQLVSNMGALARNVIIAYGGTECLTISGKIVSDADEYEDYNCGQVIFEREVKVVDKDGNTVPVCTRGEIYIKGKSLFQEYFNEPEKTKAACTEDGWYKTDDMGRMNENGMLFVEGRKSNMILSGGMNVNPEILETLIMECPGVEGVVVVPVPDDIRYQVICACVKVTPDSTTDEISVRKFCEDAHGDKLGLFTVLPTYYLLLESFPETTTGKVSRTALTDLASKHFRR